jgi:hypothetical protein
MAQIVKLRRSATTGNKPTTAQLELGELAMNTYDGKIYFEKSGSAGESIEEILTTNAQNTGSLSISGSSHNITGALELSGSVKLPNTVRDYTNSTGSVGQVLQITENGAIWIDNTAANVGDGRTAKQTFAASTTWVFTHNLNEKYPVVELYDIDDQILVAPTIATNANTLTITFAIPVAGTAVATVGGMRGYQGFQGFQGQDGYVGADGVQGNQGDRGFQGFQGVKGDQGVTGAQGFQGPIGFQGSQGETGAQGAISASARNVTVFTTTLNQTTFTVPGGYNIGLVDVFWNGVKQTVGVDYTASNGTTVVLANGAAAGDTIEINNYLGEIGSQGNQGATGAQGSVGAQGVTGNQGAVGAQGPTGSQGSVGAQGSVGPQGETGFQGNQGPTGLQGAKGDQGFQGIQGFQGDQGIQGTKGDQGDQGFQGAKGDQGNQGPIGPQGIKGDKGDQGDRGFQGFQGIQGTVGTQGATGVQGAKGDQGYQGITGQGFIIYQTYNSVAALLADNTCPDGQFGLVGGSLSQSDPDYGKLYLRSGGVWSFTTDMSVQGIQGSTGAQGSTGQQGFKGDQGNQGDQGARGFQGDQGRQGAQGDQGTQGFQGIKGDKGDKGDQGDRGFKGDQGDRGFQGFKGDQGDRGFQGFKGDKGDKGDQGDRGFQGFKGDKGDKGDQGDRGFQGFKGDKGDKGDQGDRGFQGFKGDQGTAGSLDAVARIGDTMTGPLVVSGIDSAIKVQHDGTSTAWRGRLGSFNASADKSSFLGNYTGRPGVFGHNNALTAWDDLWVNTLGIYGQGNTYLSWFSYVKGNSNDTNYAVWHAGNLTNLNQLTNGPGYITGYTETDTLQSVILRNGTTNTGFTITNTNDTYSTPGNTNVPLIYLYNTGTTSTANAVLSLRTNSSTGGDPILSFDIGGVQGWSMGIDNSDADRFKIARSWASLDSDTRFRMDVDGTAAFTGNLTAANLSGTNTGDQINISGSAGSLSDDSGYIRTRGGGSEGSLDSYTDNAVRSITFTGYSQHLLSWNVGGSTGTIQQLFHYNTPTNGWRIRNKTDNNSWSSWGYVVMAQANQGNINGTIYHTGNLTNLNQLTNGPGYITGETDTLASVTGRGASTDTAITINNLLTITGSRLLVQTGGTNTYGIVSGYNNSNHMMTMRASVTGATSSPTFNAVHQMTFIEYAQTGDDTGWYFKSSSTGAYEEIARITRTGMNVSGHIRTTQSVYSGGNFEMIGAWSNSPFPSSSWIRATSGGGLFLVNNNITAWAGLKTDGSFHVSNSASFASSLSVSSGLSAGNVYSDNGYRNAGNYFEKLLGVPYFDNGVSNLAIDLILGNVSWWGYFEIEITSTYSFQSSGGKLTKVFATSTNPGGSIYTNESRIVDSMGDVPVNIAIGDFTWSSSRGAFIVPIYHIVNSGNSYTIKVRMFSHGGGAESVYNAMYLSSIYTQSGGIGRQWPFFNSRLGIATTTPSYNLDVNGNARISNITVHEAAVRLNSGSGGNSPKLVFGTEDESVAGHKSIYLETYWMVIQPHVNEGLRLRFVNGSGSQTEAITFQSTNTTIRTKITYNDNTYMTGSPSYGFRFNSANDAYNNVIMHDSGNMGIRGRLAVGTTSGSPDCMVLFTGNSGASGYSTSDQNNILHLSRNSHAYILMSSPNEYDQGIHFANTSDNSLVGRFAYQHKASGDLMNWTINAAVRLELNSGGTLTASGDIVAYGNPSDARLKTIKEKVPNALDKVMQLNGYRFDWNEINNLTNIKEDIGVIAQEVESILPELARTNENGYMSVRYQGLTAVLIEAIKEQQTQIESQKSEIEELKDLVKQLINR